MEKELFWGWSTDYLFLKKNKKTLHMTRQKKGISDVSVASQQGTL